MYKDEDSWKNNCKYCPFFEDCKSRRSTKECTEFLNEEMNKSLIRYLKNKN